MIKKNTKTIIEDFLESILQIYSHNNSSFYGKDHLISHYGNFYIRKDDCAYEKGCPKCCFENAYKLAKKHNLIYCEGYAVSKVFDCPLEHAWCIDKNKNVIDNTWEDGVEYFGIAFELSYVRQRILKTKQYGVFGFPRDKSWVNGLTDGVLA